MTARGPAGWYVQPDGRQRYWDGTAWTEHWWPAPEPGPRPETSTRTRVVWGVLLTVGVAVAYGVPFFGFLGSLVLPLIVVAQADRLWPGVSRRRVGWAAALGVVGMWLPAIADYVTPVFYLLGTTASTSWLVLPLCGPEETAAWVLPAVAAAAVAGLGVAVSMLARSPWLWVVALWLAPWAHMVVFMALSPEIIC